MKTSNSLPGKVLMLAFVIAFTLYACSSDKPDNESETSQETVIEESVTETEELIEYPLPTPFEITTMLNNAGASYIYDLSNSNENVDKYETEKAKALNLGVYCADLSYANTYNQSQETWLFINCATKLTEELEIPHVFTPDMQEKINSNLENKDSLYTLITNIFYQTFDKLNRDERGNISLLVLAGGWIEGLHISTQLARTARDKNLILEGIASQKQVYDKLKVLLERYKDNADIQDFSIEFDKMKVVFDAVENKNLTDQQFEDLTTIVEGIRQNIVE